MQHCPSCANEAHHRFRYREGEIFICDLCGLQWAHLTPEASAVSQNVTGVHDRYMDPSSIGDTESYPPYKDFFKRIGQKYGDKNLNILDIGCGNGAFLVECLRRGHEVRGVELNEIHKATMAQEISSRVVFGNINDVDLGKEQFDVVTFWDSFEHIPTSFDLLVRLRRQLRLGGCVFLRVNNTRDVFNFIVRLAMLLKLRIAENLIKACFNLPQHVWNFSFRAMKRMLLNKGWEIIYFRSTETPVSRFTGSLMLGAIIQCAYLVNSAMRGGKIGEYYIVPVQDEH